MIKSISFGLFVLLIFPCVTQAKSLPYYNELRVEIPADGGGLLMASRMWQAGRFLHFGLDVGGGLIKKDFELDYGNGNERDAETEAIIFPYIGPRVTFLFHVIGVSLGYGAFYAKTDFEAEGPNGQTFKGETDDWGTAFYSPILSVDFYHRKADMYFGIGVGGFFGSSFPDLEGTRGASRIVTDESPIETITISLSTKWAGKRWRRESHDGFN